MSMTPPLIELAGEAGAPPLHLAVANGFPPKTYAPLLQALSGHRAVALTPRALRGDQAPPADYRDWNADAEDLLAGLQAHDPGKVIALGHSLGGVVSLLALLREPARVKAVVALDPPILLPFLLQMIKQAWDGGYVDQIPMVQSARRRRQTFESRQDAFARFRGKRVFADWTDEALWLYVEQAIVPNQTGGGFCLAWSIEWEAHYFATVYLKIWEDLPRLRGAAPILFIRGDDSDTFSREAYHRVRAILPTADFELMLGQGHLFPLAAPAETARLIRGWLESKGL